MRTMKNISGMEAFYLFVSQILTWIKTDQILGEGNIHLSDN